MNRHTTSLLVVLSLSLSAPVSAQSDWVQQVLNAAKLPVSAAEARTEGVPNEEIRAVLDVMLESRVPAGDAATVLDEARAARREHGPVDNFGAFVQSKLDAGLRGRELAAAIRAEHAARGRGRGNAAAPGRSGTRSKGDEAGRRDTSRGRSEASPPRPPNPPASKGRPETRGRPTDRPVRPLR